ncbi:hypothetical protein CASFOL_038184 [Castilleja foliolosa]|uniref:BSD domain-containing protein n=1 Tax=Castilleja foliolosa TaxID=1961234 RepID=A0ABD3BKA1_9LAMI
MSWLARSIANSLRLDEEEDGPKEEEKNLYDAVPRPTPYVDVPLEDRPQNSTSSAENLRSSDSDGVAASNNCGDEDLDGDDDRRGVKEDLSELKDSLKRQLWGVASFLAPPPPPPPPPPLIRRSGSVRFESKSDGTGSGNDEYEEDGDELVEHDEGEPGQFLEFAHFSPSEDYYSNVIEDAIGITEEVLAFGRNIAHHPETWLDFPLSEEEEFDDFDISDSQYKHALAVEHLSPRLAALRIELCPVHMSEGYFWMVYFVLLHSRLNKHDADLLSSPQLLQARSMWMQELQKQSEESSWLGLSTFHSKEYADSPRQNSIMHSYEDGHSGNVSEPISPVESSMHQMKAVHGIEKHSINEIEFIDKSVIKEDLAPELQEKEMIVSCSYEMPVQDDDDDDDDWLKEDSDLIAYSGTSIVGNEEDISFSDLEDDSDFTMPTKYKIASTEGNTINRSS